MARVPAVERVVMSPSSNLQRRMVGPGARRAIGPALVVVVAVAALGSGSLGVGCSRNATPAVEPMPADEAPPPPLPPASGTPIGYLVDESRLKLRDDQLAKLKDIDAELAGKLQMLDAIQRDTESAAQAAPADSSRGGATIGGARAEDGMGPGTGAARSSEPRRLKDPGRLPGPDAAPASKEDIERTRKRLPEVRAYDVREAIQKALALLDRDQQKIAREVLKERGVDPDTGKFDASGQPGVVAPEEGSGSAVHFGRKDR